MSRLRPMLDGSMYRYLHRRFTVAL